MTRWHSSGGAFYDRIMARLNAYTPAQVESFKSVVDGVEPEDRFTELVKANLSPNDTALDLGTGTGSWFLREVAAGVGRAVGVDESRLSLAKACQRGLTDGVSNVAFLQADGTKLPLPNEAVDLVISRRGPLTASVSFLEEAHRVLVPGGSAIEITIGEQNGREVTEIFGYSQMAEEAQLGPRLPRLEALFRSRELEPVVSEDYCQVEYFPSAEALRYRLLTTPILQDYDPDSHIPKFQELVNRFGAGKGIMLTYHRIIVAARKAA